jgi:hypothetical protein
MERFTMVLVLLCCGLTVPAVGQTATPSLSNSAVTEKAITLNEQQKQAVIDAAVTAKSRQKTPKEFSPTVGATVPKEVYLHAFRPDETQKTPLLKGYQYAFLDREVVLVGGPKNKVVAVVALPEKLVAGEQAHQGAAEASSTDAKGDYAPPHASVPSHTSPESIK